MKDKPAIIVMDMLNDFVHGALKCERAGKLIPVLQKLLASAREAEIPVVYCCDAHLPVDFEMAVWGEHAMAGTPGAQVVPELEPQAGDYQVTKRAYSGFHDTGLDSLLRALDVDRIVLTGVHTHICGIHTAADAFFRGYAISVVTDATDAFTERHRDEGLQYLNTIYGAELVTSDQLVAAWAKAVA